MMWLKTVVVTYLYIYCSSQQYITNISSQRDNIVRIFLSNVYITKHVIIRINWKYKTPHLVNGLHQRVTEVCATVGCGERYVVCEKVFPESRYVPCFRQAAQPAHQLGRHRRLLASQEGAQHSWQVRLCKFSHQAYRQAYRQTASIEHYIVNIYTICIIM